jgi:hypothetical protein
LSGGRDSRHIFLELTRLGTPFKAFTVDVDNADDAAIAAALCAQYQVPHTVVPMSRPSLAQSRSMELATHYATIEHRWMTGMVEVIPEGVVFDGVAGDVLSAGHFSSERRLSLYRSSQFEELAASLPGVDEKSLRALLAPWLYEKISSANATLRLVNEVAGYADTPSPIAEFFLANRTRRVASLMATAVFSHCVGLTPFFLGPVYELLITLPGEMTVDTKLHTETIAQAFPECKHAYSQKRKPSTARRYMAEALTASAAWRQIANMDYLLPRLARGSVDGAYSARSGWLVNVAQYLHHIGVGRL